MGLVEKPVNRFLVRKVENSRAEGTPDAAHRAAPVLGKISPVTALPKRPHRAPGAPTAITTGRLPRKAIGHRPKPSAFRANAADTQQRFPAPPHPHANLT